MHGTSWRNCTLCLCAFLWFSCGFDSRIEFSFQLAAIKMSMSFSNYNWNWRIYWAKRKHSNWFFDQKFLFQFFRHKINFILFIVPHGETETNRQKSIQKWLYSMFTAINCYLNSFLTCYNRLMSKHTIKNKIKRER